VEEYLVDLQSLIPGVEFSLEARSIDSALRGLGVDKKEFIETMDSGETPESRIAYHLLVSGTVRQGYRRLLVHTAVRYLGTPTGRAILSLYFLAKSNGVAPWDALMLADWGVLFIAGVHPYGRLVYSYHMPRSHEGFLTEWQSPEFASVNSLCAVSLAYEGNNLYPFKRNSETWEDLQELQRVIREYRET
jgi:hypothetical protein